MVSDFREAIPTSAFLNALIIERVVRTDVFAGCARDVLAEASHSDTELQYEFINPAYIVGLLYCLIVVPKETWILTNHDPIYKRLQDDGLQALFKIKMTGYKEGNSDDPPMHYLIARLRNAVAHTHYSIDQFQAWTFWDQKTSSSPRFWEASIPNKDLSVFLSKLAHVMHNKWRLSMFQIDERIDNARLQQFATQIAHVSDAEKELFESNFSNAQSDDFQAGLLAGLAGTYQIMSTKMSPQDKFNLIGHLVAFVADKIARRGI